jgi:hypothetical protein
VVGLLGATMWAQTATTESTTKATTTHKKRAVVAEEEAPKPKMATAEDVQAVRDALNQQIQKLQEQLDKLQSATSQAQQTAQTAVSQSAEQKQDEAAVRSDVTDLKTALGTTTATLQETQKKIDESPVALRYKGITLTPGGFLAAENVWRQRALASDINSAFSAVPFAGNSQSQMSEFFASGRQSRISLLAEGKLSNVKLTGYVETDFLSAGVTSNNNQSNSYTLRQRQAWGQAALSGWTFTGGQMWSLVTETRKGLDNRTEALPMTIDAQYNVGFSWARQYGFRVTKNFGNKVWLGVSVEDPQTIFTAHGQAANFLIGSTGTGGGLYNSTANYSFNPAPDFVVKAAFEPGWGHYEVFAVVRQFRDRVFPNALTGTPSAAGAFNDSRTGGGVGANARVALLNKHVDLGVHFLGGDGIGRYGTTTLPDATARPDGTLALVRSGQALGTLEFHFPKFDIYTNAGTEYAGRTAYVNAAGKGVGYGSPLFSNFGCTTELVAGSGGFAPTAPGNCTGDTRVFVEGTVGFWYRFYKGAKGTLQVGPQYSHVVRNTWSGTGGEPQGTDNMVFTSFRYYLP